MTRRAGDEHVEDAAFRQTLFERHRSFEAREIVAVSNTALGQDGHDLFLQDEPGATVLGSPGNVNQFWPSTPGCVEWSHGRPFYSHLRCAGVSAAACNHRCREPAWTVRGARTDRAQCAAPAR